MSDAIKTISLDDIGGLQGQGKEAPKPANVMYNPQYAGGDQFQTETSAASDLDQVSDVRPLSSISTGSSFGTSLTRMTEIFGRFDSGSNTRNYIIVGVLVLALAAALYLTSGDGTESPLSQILSQFGSTSEMAPESPADDMMPESAPTMMAPTTQQVAPAPPPKVETPPTPQVDLQNPYWALPNPLENTTGPEGGILNPAQEERWRQGLAHPFVWQRYKTVIDMRKARLKGSQNLLNDALAQPKFWTRMEALIALAESGVAVDIDTVEAGIGSTRRSLIQNYFRRFRRAATGGEIYIMRQAIRIMDAGTRRVILESLIRRRDPINDLYLVAATYDPNIKVNGWINQELAGRPLSEAARVRFQQVAAGLDVPPAATPTPTPAGKVQDLKVEELSDDDVNVEEVYFLKEEDRQETKIVPMDDGFQELESP
ncbi:hypothetical protein [Oligoflexus tunisiensis]|uniref:hypothetical protein n=1 Tax=Oligoflexus tunisiensis TaxID=708132 RepID=UPI00114CDC29|nr:hypothetical protein [Oligoflexus tunisiensis]